jgi:prepilin signal peptidase PulO-like enzyme (type II secretory pathway)
VEYFEIGIWAVLGLIAGSFVHVCRERLPLQFANDEQRSSLLTSPELSPYLKKHLRERTLSLANPARSFCFSCGHQLSWFENIPILSYVLSRGHCRKCNAPIGAATILTETVHGLVYLGFGWFLNGWIWPLTFSINFSFLWILGNCWKEQRTRKRLLFAGAILLILNFGVYHY